MQLAQIGSVERRNLETLRRLIWQDREPHGPNPNVIWAYKYMFSSTPGGDESYVRFEEVFTNKGGESVTHTFRLKKALTKLIFCKVALSTLEDQELLQITRVPIEFPESWLEPAESHPMDKATQNDLRRADDYGVALQHILIREIKKIAGLCNAFTVHCPKRDHDLVLSYVLGGEHHTEFRVRLDKIYPKFIEGMLLGDGEKLELDYTEGHQIMGTALRRMKAAEKKVNNEIKRLEKLGDFSEFGIELFNRSVRTQLFAAGHFNQMIYTFDMRDGREILEQVTNEILGALAAIGGSIALDITSWWTWEYHTDGSPPNRVEDPSLNFTETILNSYTQSFIDALTGTLQTVGSPYLRPFHHREAADASDGIEVGAIRRA